MRRPARGYAGRAALAVLLAVGLAVGAARADGREPPMVDANDPALVARGDALLYDGEPFTGTVRGRWPGGAVRELRAYRRGREHGRHVGWWEDGRARFRHDYADGAMHGESAEWDAAGRLVRRSTYVAGREEGLQRLWNADGSLRASYVMRAGRRYGFIGATGCDGGDSSRTTQARTGHATRR